jgi:hypothetical protein
MRGLVFVLRTARGPQYFAPLVDIPTPCGSVVRWAAWSWWCRVRGCAYWRHLAVEFAGSGPFFGFGLPHWGPIWTSAVSVHSWCRGPHSRSLLRAFRALAPYCSPAVRSSSLRCVLGAASVPAFYAVSLALVWWCQICGACLGL